MGCASNERFSSQEDDKCGEQSGQKEVVVNWTVSAGAEQLCDIRGGQSVEFCDGWDAAQLRYITLKCQSNVNSSAHMGSQINKSSHRTNATPRFNSPTAPMYDVSV